ncbi:MAG: NAD(P)-dependent oxidoreductase [Pseudomonadota bacterium]
MNVLIADKVPGWFVEKLKAAGCNVLWEPTLEADALTAAITAHEPAVIVVRSTKVQKAQIEAGAALKMVIRAGAGVNTIDVACATERGVKVCNCPGTNSAAVAELAIGHLINLDRRIADGVADLKAGVWNKKGYSKANGLKGRTLGILGMGNIGILTARIAQAMGMQIVTWDPFLSWEKAEELGVRKTDEILEVAREADAVSVHLALVPPTRGLVGAEFIGAMKPGAYLINTSRAEVLDKAAVVAGIQEKGLRLGTDVYWSEPAANDTVFADDVVALPGVYGTHHIGASTDQAQDAVSEMAWDIMDTFLTTAQIINAVN